MINHAIPRGSRVTIRFVATLLSDANEGSSAVFVDAPSGRSQHFDRELITDILPPIQRPGANVANTATDEYGVVVVHDPATASYVVRVGEALTVWPDDQHTVPQDAAPKEVIVEAPAPAPAPPTAPSPPCPHCGDTDGDHADDCPEAIPF